MNFARVSETYKSTLPRYTPTGGLLNHRTSSKVPLAKQRRTVWLHRVGGRFYSTISVEHSDVAPRWTLIKAVPSGNAVEKENLERECRIYQLDGVSSAICFRKMYKTIAFDPDNREYIVALGWLDTTLAQETYRPDSQSYALLWAVLKAALESCTVLNRHDYVNTDYKSANVLLSGVGTNRITAKIGDLGLVFPTGTRYNAQPYALRAPEVFLGSPCSEPSQIWAIASMILCWIKPGILGEWDSPHPLINAAWCMAKIKRLFPDWHLSLDEIEGYVLQTAVKSARRISKEEPILQQRVSFDSEIRAIDVLPELRDLLSWMLSVDPDLRPSPSTILSSEQFIAFGNAVNS